MKHTNLWMKAKESSIQVSDSIGSGFDIAFDERIPQTMQDELRTFVKWVEHNYVVPVTLWVAFEYRHYLMSGNKRVGYLFCWADFSEYPVFDNKEDIPIIKLPVRTEHSSLEEILISFIEAITDYYAWICNEISPDFIPDDHDVEEILQEYLRFRG